MTTNELLILLLLLGALASLFGWLSVQAKRSKAMREARMQQEQQTRNEAKCKAIEADLQDWLKMLELPALAEQTRLEAAARQLRIVLVERLVNGPRVH